MDSIVGLDIGSHSLKAVELQRNKNDLPKLLAYGQVLSPPGILLSEAEEDQNKLTQLIKNLWREYKFKSRKVVTAFPESRIFTRVIELPPLNQNELHQAIEWEAERFIPLPKDKVQSSWMVLDPGQPPSAESEGRKMKILLVAAPLDLVKKYLDILERANLEPVAFETELIGLVRALAYRSDLPVTLLIALGGTTTDLCIVDQGIIQFTRSIGTGGEALTKAIARELGFEKEQAEEYKRAYGLMEDKLGGKILKVLKPVFDIIVNEIEKAILSYQTKQPLRPVKRVVLTGGGAQLPGVVVYLAESLGVEVQIGDPWSGIELGPSFEEKIHSIANQTLYAVAVGLARKPV